MHVHINSNAVAYYEIKSNKGIMEIMRMSILHLSDKSLDCFATKVNLNFKNYATRRTQQIYLRSSAEQIPCGDPEHGHLKAVEGSASSYDSH
jgi:hypothetical protein